MRVLILLILSSLAIVSCNTTKVLTSISRDSTSLTVNIDSSFLLKKDTIRFDSLLNKYLLLEGELDSLNNISMFNDSTSKSTIDSILILKRKAIYITKIQLQKGAIIDATYILLKDIYIISKDTSYVKPLEFLLKIHGDSIGLEFNSDITILTSETINTTTINRKVTFITWIFHKYTLYLMGLFFTFIIFLLILLKLK